MQGSIYQIAEARYGNQPHLYVVVLEFTGNKDCIVVPAFSAEGHMVNEAIRARLDQGYRLDQIAVTLDNARHVTFQSTHTGKPAHWLVADFDRLQIADVRSNTLLGKMDEDGLKLVAAALLGYAEPEGRLSAAAVRKLRQLTR